jgi:hypothetical protein
MNIAGLSELAKIIGVSRQGLTQALARSISAPRPLTQVGEAYVYDRDAVLEWWEHHLADRIRQVRSSRSRVPTAQMNIRITSDDWTFLDSIRGPQESMSSAGRRLLLEAIEARKIGTARP